MPKSNTVNRMPRERERERERRTREREGSRYTVRRKMGRDRKQGSRQRELTKARRREHQRRIEEEINFSLAATEA